VAYFRTFSLADLQLGTSPLGPASVLIPVIGALHSH
jgi:hypothetical protein